MRLILLWINTILILSLALTVGAQEIEITPEVTPEVLQLDMLVGTGLEPPFELTLPDDWGFAHDTLLVDDIGELRPIPFSIYSGDVTGGQGFIVVLWGFPSVTNANPFSADYAVPNLWIDGLRLLRLVILEAECNIGTDLQRDYTIGGLEAVGTKFAAVDCPELEDTRGWFAGLAVDEMNFSFYMYTEPIQAMDGPADKELQAILDTVSFDVPAFLERFAELTAEMTPEATESP
ncbi:hypothetical protein MASR2M15_15290 [Anaerolineales bacterium]